MIPHCWIEMQVFSMPLGQIKQVLGRKRLRIDRKQIVAYLIGLMSQQTLLRHHKAIHALDNCGVGYAAFMHGVGLVAPLWRHLEQDYRNQQSIGFDMKTLVDSSLLPSKDQASIRSKDWEAGRCTVRPGLEGSKQKICGEKMLTVLNSLGQIVSCSLMPTINSADDHVFKQPLYWARQGLRQGVLLVDRGFSNKAVRSGIDFLRKTLPGYTVKLISPPRARQTWILTADERALYRERWAIEEVFRQLKDPQGRFRLTMRGVRRSVIREARVAIATLAWNMEHT